MRVLHIEDDASTADATKIVLGLDGIDAVNTELGEDGISLARTGEFDAILLDLKLPDMTGQEVVCALRSASVGTPVLVLSGDPSPESRIRLLRSGADDFLPKPYEGRELVARLKAITRRAGQNKAAQIRCGKLVVDIASKTARADASFVNLTGREYAMLEHFVQRKGSVVTKSGLMAQLYGGLDEPDAKIIDVFVCKLRKKISAATGGEAYIHTVWGAGYQMREPA
jgi:two-component system cell cycle response regulator CtrA